MDRRIFGPANLLEDLGDHPCTHSLASFSQGEAQAVRHGHSVNELDVEGGVLSWCDHLHARLQVARARHVGSAEEELRPVGEGEGVCAWMDVQRCVNRSE